MLAETSETDALLCGVELAGLTGNGAVGRKEDRHPRMRAAVDHWEMSSAATAARRVVASVGRRMARAEGDTDASFVAIVAGSRLHILRAVPRMRMVNCRAATMLHWQGADAINRMTTAVVVGDEALRVDDAATRASSADVGVAGVVRTCFGFWCCDECCGSNDNECQEFLHGLLNWDSRRSTGTLPNLFNGDEKTFGEERFQKPHCFPIAQSFDRRHSCATFL